LTVCPDPVFYVDDAPLAVAASCEALAERLEASVAATEDLAALTSGAPSSTTLAPADAARLDLTWTGIWFTGGVAFGVWAFRRLGREATRWGDGA